VHQVALGANTASTALGACTALELFRCCEDSLEVAVKCAGSPILLKPSFHFPKIYRRFAFHFRHFAHNGIKVHISIARSIAHDTPLPAFVADH